MMPGSPHCGTYSKNFFLNVSLSTVFLINTAEIFALARWGFVAHQFPVLLFHISSSSIEKSAIVALLRTPPDNTQSAAWQIISLQSIGRKERPAQLNKTASIFCKLIFNGIGPGALPP